MNEQKILSSKINNNNSFKKLWDVENLYKKKYKQSKANNFCLF